MVKIYCIEDINDLKYVGSTNQKYLNDRLCQHRCDKRNLKKRRCSSDKLNLEYCIIYELETCDEKDRQRKEDFWIDKIDCVNERSALQNKKNVVKYKNDWYKKNSERILNKKKFIVSFGGDKRFHNNLLLIDVDLFLQ